MIKNIAKIGFLSILFLIIAGCTSKPEIATFKTTDSKNSFTNPDTYLVCKNQQNLGQLIFGNWTTQNSSINLGGKPTNPDKPLNVSSNEQIKVLFYKPRTLNFLNAKLSIKIYNKNKWQELLKNKDEKPISQKHKIITKTLFNPQEYTAKIKIKSSGDFIALTTLDAKSNKKPFGQIVKAFWIRVN